MTGSPSGDRRVVVVLPLPPSLNRTYRIGATRSGKGMMFRSKEASNYKTACLLICRRELAQPFIGPVLVRLRVVRPRKAGDLDNYLKVLFDALQGLLYVKDSQIRGVEAILDDSENWHPRVIVEVWELP